MIRKQIYRYEREDGGITLSPKKPPDGVGYQIRWRLLHHCVRLLPESRKRRSISSLNKDIYRSFLRHRLSWSMPFLSAEICNERSTTCLTH